MTAVFSHGRLRLYLLKLLAEGPKHGYELIRLLENRFLGLYAPSAGTIYPRLQRMEAEGLVTHTAAGGRKTYEITDAGREELRQRSAELSSLEAEIHASVADLSSLASEIQNEVRGSVRDIKRELREQARQARSRRFDPRASWERSAWDRPASDRSASERSALERSALERSALERSALERPASDRPASDRPASDRPAWEQAQPGVWQARSGADGPETGAPTPTSAALERQAADLLAEVRRLVRRPGATQELLETAASAIEAALAVLRRL